MTIAEKQRNVLDDLAIFPDSLEREAYLISVGKKTKPLPENFRTDDREVKGCQAKLWLDAYCENGKVYFLVDSESHITKGIVNLLVSVLDGETPDDILQADLTFLATSQLKNHLSSMRANALTLMPIQMKQRALKFAIQP